MKLSQNDSSSEMGFIGSLSHGAAKHPQSQEQVRHSDRFWASDAVALVEEERSDLLNA